MVIEQLKNGVETIALLMKGYKKDIGEEELSAGQLEALEKAISNGDITFFTAKSEGKAVAMCSVTRTFSTFSCAYSGVFEDFYISPQYRGSGLARLLTAHVFDYCRQSGILSLWVGSADCDVEMYKKLGFEIPLGNLLTWSAD